METPVPKTVAEQRSGRQGTNPQAGHEQAGRCPAFVSNPGECDEKSNVGLFFAVTSAASRIPGKLNALTS